MPPTQHPLRVFHHREVVDADDLEGGWLDGPRAVDDELHDGLARRRRMWRHACGTDVHRGLLRLRTRDRGGVRLRHDRRRIGGGKGNRRGAAMAGSDEGQRTHEHARQDERTSGHADTAMTRGGLRTSPDIDSMVRVAPRQSPLASPAVCMGSSGGAPPGHSGQPRGGSVLAEGGAEAGSLPASLLETGRPFTYPGHPCPSCPPATPPGPRSLTSPVREPASTAWTRCWAVAFPQPHLPARRRAGHRQDDAGAPVPARGREGRASAGSTSRCRRARSS